MCRVKTTQKIVSSFSLPGRYQNANQFQVGSSSRSQWIQRVQIQVKSKSNLGQNLVSFHRRRERRNIPEIALRQCRMWGRCGINKNSLSLHGTRNLFNLIECSRGNRKRQNLSSFYNRNLRPQFLLIWEKVQNKTTAQVSTAYEIVLFWTNCFNCAIVRACWQWPSLYFVNNTWEKCQSETPKAAPKDSRCKIHPERVLSAVFWLDLL